MTPDAVAAEVIKAHIDKELKGKLQKIERNYDGLHRTQSRPLCSATRQLG